MPLKSKSQFDSLLAMTAMFTDTELQALADKCQTLITNREQIKRNQLRQELMENLQKTISDILDNGFALTIENTDDPIWKVCFGPQDNYHIEIE